MDENQNSKFHSCNCFGVFIRKHPFDAAPAQGTIEVKATKRLDSSDFKGIKALKEDGLIKKYFIVSRDPADAVRNETACLHWKSFIEKLWADALI
jgi:hypothetical protein